MSAKIALQEFRKRRKLLLNVRYTEATTRLSGFFDFLKSTREIAKIIHIILSQFPVHNLIARCNEETPPKAGKREEIVSVGLHLMDECRNTRNKLYEIAKQFGMLPARKSRLQADAQDFVDEAMERYIEPTLDFIEERLEEAIEEEKQLRLREEEKKKISEKVDLKVVPSKEKLEKPKDHTRDKPLVERASIGAYSISDQPTDVDSLGFEPYTTAIAEFLGHGDTRPPLTMSIEGEWGSGKSSFMMQLEKKVVIKGGLIVKFSPWRHEEEKSVWAAFALEFIRQLSVKLKWCDRCKANVKLIWARFSLKNGWFDVLKFVSLLGAWVFGVITVILMFMLKWEFLPNLGASVTLKLVSIFGVVYFAGWVLKRLKEMFGNPFDLDLKKYMSTPDYVGRISFVEQFHKDFKKVVEVYAGKRKVYVFIDDVDRCMPPKAADLMQAVNLMISDNPRLIFIIGMAREKVAAGLAVKHEKLLPYITSQRTDTNHSSGLGYGYSFIEKFIQLPFNIPRPTETDIENLMDNISETHQVDRVESPSGKQIDGADKTVGVKQNIEEDLEEEKVREQRRETLRLKLAGDSPKIREIVLMVAPVFDYNPRRVKQFINLFRLRVYIASETGLFDILESETQFNRLTLEQLGKYVAITMDWPSLIADLSQDTDLLKKLFGTSEKESERESDYDQRWFKDERLMSLVEYVPDKKRDKGESLEWTQYSLLYVDVKKLLEISPPITTGEDVLQQDLETTQEKYKAFYGELLDSIKEKRPEIAREKASPQNYLSLHTGYGGIHFEWAFHGRPRSWFEVGLHFEKSSKDKNMKFFKYFVGIKDELKKSLKSLDLKFEPDWGMRCARIYVRKNESEMNKILGDWAVETMDKFYDVFKPLLDKFIKGKTGKREVDNTELENLE